MVTEFSVIWLPAFMMGLLGSTHCMGMCGGITVALSSGCEPQKQAYLSLIYQLCRVISYAILGAVVGLVGAVIGRWTEFPILMLFASILLIMMGLYLMGSWNLLTYLEKQGSRLWRLIQPFQKRFLPLRKASQAIPIGLLWGLLPCGLVYSALAMAAASGGALEGVITMLAFGLGTLPALYITGLFARHLIQFFRRQWVRNLIGAIFIVWGGYQLYAIVFVAQAPVAHHLHH
ncbi:sulfite exporter TauE/SafE family protein [Kangiella shandongensis]|uniref:sulfite exporter TauE/SafE family protein n=1 Tax=Kangiella shandongensis TaxID=2763258 RepID=UPI001CBBFBA6|nr:sulfite exporter TauE/SafE family protein [Kangiella shandongensis]